MGNIETEMKVLNLYSGVGGNRKLWQDVEVTAVELNEKIASIYSDLYPGDKVVVADAHQYLLDHYSEFDFIWSSPPCPSHSQVNHFLNAQGVVRYPDMSLWQEIIFLQNFYSGKFCVENVVSYYDPLIPPQLSGRHYFWANFRIPKDQEHVKIGRMAKLKNGQHGDGRHKLDGIGIDLSKYSGIQKEKLLRNCVSPEIGNCILNCARGIIERKKSKQETLFQ